MSILTACQAVINETGIGTAPASIISNTDPTAVQLLALVTRSGNSLMRAYNWQRMIREQTIATVNGTEGYDIPSDWLAYIGDTAWDSTNYWQMRGSLGPSEWQFWKRSQAAISTTHKMLRLRGNQVLIIPTPTAVESLVLEYVRNTPFADSTVATYRVAPTVDSDVTVIPEHLVILDMKWRLLRAKGLSYDEEFAEFGAALEIAKAKDTPAYKLDFGSVTAQPAYTMFPNIPPTVV